MTDQEIKAEADKIIQEFYEKIPEKVFETSLNYDILHELGKRCAIIQVKAQINLVNDIGLIYEIYLEYYVQKFQSILTELERK